MNAVTPIALTRWLKKLGLIVEKYHVTIVVVVVFGTLIAVVAAVNNTLSQPPDEEYRSQAQQKSLHAQFDEETIQAIKNLRARQENTSFTLPVGRNNPFTE